MNWVFEDTDFDEFHFHPACIGDVVLQFFSCRELSGLMKKQFPKRLTIGLMLSAAWHTHTCTVDMQWWWEQALLGRRYQALITETEPSKANAALWLILQAHVPNVESSMDQDITEAQRPIPRSCLYCSVKPVHSGGDHSISTFNGIISFNDSKQT